MSRRTKLIITALLLVLLAIPALYITLSWNTQATLEFRYLGQGAPTMDPVRERLEVPFKIEVRNTQPYSMHLWTMELMGLVTLHETQSPVSGGNADANANPAPAPASHKLHLPIGRYRSFAMDEVEDGVPPVPAHGSMQVEIYVVQSTVPQVDPASLHLSYVSSSVTKNQAIKLANWTERKLWDWFKYDRRLDANLQPGRHHAPLRGTDGQPVRFEP